MTSHHPVNIFMLGATGYVGGSFLSTLLASPEPPHKITALIRSNDKLKIFENLSEHKTNCIGVQGSYEDHHLLEDLSAEHPVVISAADADDVGMIKAVLKGMKKRHENTGKVGVLIHVSGTGTIIDDARGEYEGKDIYTDLPEPSSAHPDTKTIQSLPDDAFHRPVDLLVEEADKEGYCRTYIILPGTIWGDPDNMVAFEKGLSNPHSQQIPGAAAFGIDRGQAGVTGKGLNRWVHVHILEVASLFEKLYPLALADKAPHGAPTNSGYYFATSGEYSIGEAMKLIGEEMFKQGWASTAEVKPFSVEELEKRYGKDGWRYPGSNSRCFAENSEKILGWKGVRGVGEKSGEWDEYVRSETRRKGQEAKEKKSQQ
ncbi:hypothetical protein BD324DRAFT_612232 [Kockovaella imperatae]|uniref:NAD(P)-binding domain-containing protein n=1 Tax=Kockovaella imperatae TaxID=4999 RepID=A0A1Y1US70_9TREE|nr:hypothetical protein BD324DRAFT_612232 [Kockovaella imperatae]ORX40829.1 hypothetical protein BD324DRAFT_612232 [Kockovaella imperatae]